MNRTLLCKFSHSSNSLDHYFSAVAKHVECYISLGSNLGNRRSFLRRANQLISHRVAKLTAKSFIYESAPWGVYEGETYPYLNGVVLLKTSLPAAELLDILQGVENDLGRTRSIPNAPRNIDLDLLFYGQEVILTKRLQIPHPHLDKRRFVLQPLSDVNPFFIHPTLSQNVRQLLEACTDSHQELQRV